MAQDKKVMVEKEEAEMPEEQTQAEQTQQPAQEPQYITQKFPPGDTGDSGDAQTAPMPFTDVKAEGVSEGAEMEGGEEEGSEDEGEEES